MKKTQINDFHSTAATLEVFAPPPRTYARNVQVKSATPKDDESNANLEAVGRIAGGVAHDFNNLLTGVLLYCDLMTDEITHSGRRVPDRNRLRHAADEIRYACQRGSALIQQLMVVARPAAFEPASASWNDATLGMSNLLRRLLGNNIELVTDLAMDLQSVDLSLTRAQQVILNLVLNSRDAMPKGGKIVLQTRNRPASEEDSLPFVELSVTDTGCGMDQQTLAHAFEMFFTTKPPDPGNGLGLATVRGIVTQAGGEILVESRPGCGTRIQVHLPGGQLSEDSGKRVVAAGYIAHTHRLHPATAKQTATPIRSTAASRLSRGSIVAPSNSTRSSIRPSTTRSSSSVRRHLS